MMTRLSFAPLRRIPCTAFLALFAAAVAGFLAAEPPGEGQLYDAALAAFERPLFAHALAATGGNQLRAARLLGINRNTLRKRLVDLEMSGTQRSSPS